MGKLVRRCEWRGLMSNCKETYYVYRDPDNIYCYYHQKIRDGLLTPEEGGAILEEPEF